MPQAGELLSLNPLSLAVWVTAEASETPALTSSNTVRNLKQPKKHQSKAKQKNQKKREKRKRKQKPKQMGVEIRSETPRLLPQFLPAWFLPAARSSPDEAVCSLTSLSLVVSIAGACKGEGGEKEKKKSFSTTRNPCSTAFGLSRVSLPHRGKRKF